MSLAIAWFTYASVVVLALSLLYLFGPLHWHWHAISVAAGAVMAVAEISVSGALVSSFYQLGYGNLAVFLLVWGSCAPFFRHHHMPPVHLH